MKSPPHPPLSPEGGGGGNLLFARLSSFEICVIERASSSFSELSRKTVDK